MTQLINCNDCEGRGKIKCDDSHNFGIMGVVFTAGLLNFFDKIQTQTWTEDCDSCNGIGKLGVYDGNVFKIKKVIDS